MKRVLIGAAALAILAGCGKEAAQPEMAARDFETGTATQGAAPAAEAGASRPVAGQAGRPPATARKLLRFEPAVIVDATGFEAPMGAVTMFLPFGWRTEGGVFWASEFMCTNGYNFLWSATSPDGAMRIALVPQTGWDYNSSGAGSNRPGCPTRQATSARQYLEETLTSLVPGARALDYRDRPDLVADVAVKPSRTAMPMGETQIWAEGGEILFAFEAGGRDMRGSMAAVVQFSKMITDMSPMYQNDPTIVAMPGAGAMRMEALTAYAFPGFAATAPNGQLNLGFFESLRKTMAPNPQWISRIAGHNAAIGRVALEESRKRAALIAQSNEDISRIRSEAFAAQQKSADWRAREFGELIRGVETYSDADASGGTVELSQNYKHAWRLNDGGYVLTDDANFDPWRDLQIEGRQLEAAK